MATLKTQQVPNNTVRIKANCSACKTSMNTIVSGKKWEITHPLHPDNLQRHPNIVENMDASTNVNVNEGEKDD